MEAWKVLLDAANLVSTGWNQARYAESDDFMEVGPSTPEAASWCLMGALIRAYEMNGGDVFCDEDEGEIAWDSHDPAVLDINDALVTVILEHDPEFYSLPKWNDNPNRTKDEVVEVLIKAYNLV